jgi:hypothetical protein
MALRAAAVVAWSQRKYGMQSPNEIEGGGRHLEEGRARALRLARISHTNKGLEE